MGTQTLDKLKSGQRQIILNVPLHKYNFFMEVLGNFNFVQVEGNNVDSREEIIANLKDAAKSLKLIKEGKLIGSPAEEFFNEL